VKILKSALWILSLALSVAFAGPSKAQDNYFSFEVCNQSGLTAYMAIVHRTQPGSPVWRRVGWYTVPNGGCTALGSYPQGWFYFMAEGQGDVIWKGETYGKRVCVSYPGPFEGSFTGDYYCGPNEVIREFNELLIAPDIGSYTLNLN